MSLEKEEKSEWSPRRQYEYLTRNCGVCFWNESDAYFVGLFIVCSGCSSGNQPRRWVIGLADLLIALSCSSNLQK